MIPPPVHDIAMLTGPGLCADYPMPAGAYDEMWAAPGVLRPQWQQLVQGLDALGVEELTRRWEQARRMIHDNGVTYNVYGEPQGMHRPWELDAIPLVIAAAEWRQLEAALVQRVRLLNSVLTDVYGEQRLLTEGLLPPELVFAHAGFLRPCHGLPVPDTSYLHLYAADLVRSPDGQWYVVADRAQSPSGAGYALENRLVLSRTLSEVFRDAQVQRLATFFDTLRQTLIRLAPRHRDNPRIVLLTPGPYNETYFEHAYLACYLGYTLVEGGDLTVRDTRVFLKTLAGLQPVDVILRRQDDAFCDPLALHPASVLGVAGLVQAVRDGNVAVANALGSGWLETPALMAFLPALCQHLLGEELALPSVPTWWCGQSEALAYVLDHREQLVIAPALPTPTPQAVSQAHDGHTAPEDEVARLQTRPYAFVAQAHVTPSTVPVWNGERMQPRHTVWRAYVAATDGGYAVMPGGLTRVSATLLSSLLLEATEYEGTVLETLLEIADSSMTYRGRYLTTLQCAPVLDLLLTDDTNPRSVVYQIAALADHVEHLPRDYARPSLSPAQRLVMTALTSLRLAAIDTLCATDDQGCRGQLSALLTRLLTDLPVLAETITQQYLSHVERVPVPLRFTVVSCWPTTAYCSTRPHPAPPCGLHL